MQHEPKVTEVGPVSRACALPSGRLKRWAILAAIAALVGPNVGEARTSNPSPPHLAASDTAKVPRFSILPLRLGERHLLSTDYLERALDESHRRAEKAATVREYARRYRISTELAQQIIEESTAEGIDPELAFRLVRVESEFKTRARGPRGALGLTQLMPSTARWLDRSLHTEADIIEPQTNLRIGFRYLRRLIEQYDDVRLGLLAYNRGEGTVNRVLRQGQDPENGYSRKVLGTSAGTVYQGEGVLPSPRD